MCSSARIAERRRAFTLLEVMVSSSLLAGMIIMIMIELRSSTALFKQGAVEAELRRNGQRALDVMASELRGTYMNGGQVTTTSAPQIQFYMSTGYDTVTKTMLLESSQRIFRYKAGSNNTILEAVNPKVPSGYEICRDLASVSSGINGLTLTASPSGGQNVPTLITIQLTLRRQVGLRSGGPWFITSTVSTSVLIRGGA